MLLAPVPLTVVCVEIASNVAMCLKPMKKTMILHGLDVLEDVVRVFVLSTTVFSIDDLRWTSLVSKVGLRFLDLTFRKNSEVESRFPNPTSGHLDRVTSWCPEVGLGIPILKFSCRLLGVQRSV